jgi:hypothetical protein
MNLADKEVVIQHFKDKFEFRKSRGCLPPVWNLADLDGVKWWKVQSRSDHYNQIVLTACFPSTRASGEQKISTGFSTSSSDRIRAQTPVPFTSEGAVSMSEEKKSFKAGKLISQSDYEAALSVLCQAIANGQVDYGSHGGGDEYEAGLEHRSKMRRFKSNDKIRADVMQVLANQEHQLKQAAELVARSKERLAHLGSDPQVTTVTGKMSFGCENIQNLPRDSVPTDAVKPGKLIISANYPGADGIGADVVTECACKYEGFKFHTGDCALKKLGPV